MPVIPLSEDQKQKLQELSKAAPELLVHRAILILAYAAGKPTLQAAGEAGISRGRARFWKRQFLARGMDIFNPDASVWQAGKGAHEAIEVRTKNARMESATGEAQEINPDSQLEIPYPQPRQSIGVSPDDTLSEAGRKVWLFHFALMLCHEEGTISGEDIEELHDMRVATRRMRTAFDIFSPAFDPKIMKHYLKGLRTIGRFLGAVRDMDVILEHALNYQRKMDEDTRPGLEPLIRAWKQVIHKKRSKMTRHLQSENYHTFKNEFNLFLQAPEQIKPIIEVSGLDSHLRDIVPVLVYSRYASVRAYESILPTASVAQLHALRIEFKKFRYVLEYFREILGDQVSHAITELKQMQDHLGELHDTDVACQLVKDFLSDWEEEQLAKPIVERENPEPTVRYLAFLHDERYRLISTFPELWKRFGRAEFRQNIAGAISQL